MELRDLEAFITVAEELHFGRAAERLNMAQPPLSNRIQKLEREVGFKLFIRNTRSVELTHSGQLFLPSAYDVLHGLVQAKETIRSINRGSFGTVRLGFAGASSQNLLPIIGRAVKEAYSEITLQYQSQTYVKSAIEQLRVNQLDLAFARLPTHPDLTSRVVRVESFVCAVPDNHPFAHRESLNTYELANEQFVSLPENRGSILQTTMLSICMAAGFHPNIVQFTPDSATALSLVAAGLGITITLSTVAETRTEGITYIPLADTNPRHMFATLTWRRDNVTPQLARVLEISEQVLPTPDLSPFQNDPVIQSHLGKDGISDNSTVNR